MPLILPRRGLLRASQWEVLVALNGVVWTGGGKWYWQCMKDRSLRVFSLEERCGAIRGAYTWLESPQKVTSADLTWQALEVRTRSWGASPEYQICAWWALLGLSWLTWKIHVLRNSLVSGTRIVGNSQVGWGCRGAVQPGVPGFWQLG